MTRIMWIDRINRIIEIKEPKNRKKIHERFEARNEILLRMLEKNLTGSLLGRCFSSK